MFSHALFVVSQRILNFLKSVWSRNVGVLKNLQDCQWLPTVSKQYSNEFTILKKHNPLDNQVYVG